MTTTPRSPTPSRRAAAWLVRAGLTVALGVAAYYGFQIADDLITNRLGEPATEGVIEVVDVPIETPAAPSEGPGNGLMRRAVLALDAHESLTAELRQDGWLDGAPVAAEGEYAQAGSGPRRRFLLRLSGRLAGEPTRLLRVSDSRFLWTDLAWGTGPDEPERAVTRVDLRLVRRALAESGPTDRLAVDPDAWSRYGGLPTLLSGLEGAFAFGKPRRMQLRQETVLAMVGRWRPERLAEMAAATPPPRAPAHVVVALSERSLMPVLIEYRDRRDPLSDPGLSDDDLLRPSRRPLLKIALAITADPAEKPDPRLFTYRPNEEGWIDQTDRELRLVERRRSPATVAATSGAPRR